MTTNKQNIDDEGVTMTSGVMPYFVKCSIESIRYMRGKIVKNRPVNLALCKSIGKGKFAWYPDNTGQPSIVFDGCDVEWAYNDEEERDSDFERLSNNKA